MQAIFWVVERKFLSAVYMVACIPRKPRLLNIESYEGNA